MIKFWLLIFNLVAWSFPHPQGGRMVGRHWAPFLSIVALLTGFSSGSWLFGFSSLFFFEIIPFLDGFLHLFLVCSAFFVEALLFFGVQTRRDPSQSRWSVLISSSSSSSDNPHMLKLESCSGSGSSGSSSSLPWTCFLSECLCRWFFWRKDLPHKSHKKGRSPVCIRQWALRWSGRLKALLQMSHL